MSARSEKRKAAKKLRKEKREERRKSYTALDKQHIVYIAIMAVLSVILLAWSVPAYMGEAEEGTTKAPETSTTVQSTTQPTTAPSVIEPTTEPTTNKPVETTKSTEPITKPVMTVPAPVVEIRKPSQTEIKYGDSIILHADVDGELPKGTKIEWTADNGNFAIVEVSADGKTCKVTPSANGNTVFTAKVVDANGKELSSDTQSMTAKAGFFQKLIAFFKKLFGMTKVIPEVFKGII
jgi:cytoskeletal protein RodZ